VVYVSTVEGIVSASTTFMYSGSWTPGIYAMSHTCWGTSTAFISANAYVSSVNDVDIQLGGGQLSSFAIQPQFSNGTVVNIGGNMGAHHADLAIDNLNDEIFSSFYSWKTIYFRPPDDLVAGFYNLSFYLQNDFSNGQASTGLARMFPFHKLTETYWNFYNFDSTLLGTVYTICLFPAISSVTPSVGSIAGGTKITIYGYGFDREISRFVVYAGGALCDVISSTDNMIQCTTRQAQNNILQFFSPTQQFLQSDLVLNTTRGFGSPGWWIKIWDYSDIANKRTGIDRYAKLSFGWRQSMYFSLYNLYGSSWPTDLNYVSKYSYSSYYYAADTASVFVVPYTGLYTFHICTDDRSTLYMSRVGIGKAETAIASCSSYCSDGNFWMFSSQISSAIPLEFGERIYLRMRTVSNILSIYDS